MDVMILMWSLFFRSLCEPTLVMGGQYPGFMMGILMACCGAALMSIHMTPQPKQIWKVAN